MTPGRAKAYAYMKASVNACALAPSPSATHRVPRELRAGSVAFESAATGSHARMARERAIAMRSAASGPKNLASGNRAARTATPPKRDASPPPLPLPVPPALPLCTTVVARVTPTPAVLLNQSANAFASSSSVTLCDPPPLPPPPAYATTSPAGETFALARQARDGTSEYAPASSAAHGFPRAVQNLAIATTSGSERSAARYASDTPVRASRTVSKSAPTRTTETKPRRRPRNAPGSAATSMFVTDTSAPNTSTGCCVSEA